MIAILVCNHRNAVFTAAALALLTVGCAREPSGSVPAPAPGVTPSVADARPAVHSAWSADTLADGDFQLEDGFRKLSLEDFDPFFAKPPQGGPATWSSIHDAIVCTGKPKGYLYSNEKFADFTLRLELRFAPAADEATTKNFNPNTGVMVYINEPHKQWPKSLEVQGKFSELATIKENGGAAKFEIIEDKGARESASKPVGEWNSLEILSKTGSLTALLNGTKICESQPSNVAEGFIGLQAEDFEVHFRRIRIRAD